MSRRLKWLIPSNKAMFFGTGLIMILLGINTLNSAYRERKVLEEGQLVSVWVDRISSGRQTSLIHFRFEGLEHRIKLSNKAIERDAITDNIQLYHSAAYPDVFIYKTSRVKMSLWLGAGLLVLGVIVLIRGILKLNVDLVG